MKGIFRGKIRKSHFSHMSFTSASFRGGRTFKIKKVLPRGGKKRGKSLSRKPPPPPKQHLQRGSTTLEGETWKKRRG